MADPVLWAALSTGFLLGLAHATDADHVAAVSALVSRHRNIGRAAKLGLFWGLGHAVTLIVFGGLVLALRIVVPSAVAQALEFLVGVMLVFLGVHVARDLWRTRLHRHGHQHPGGDQHAHLHGHEPEEAKEHGHHHLASFSVGLLHGFAGTAALVLLALASVRDPLLGAAYIVLFGFGATAGMVVLSLAVGTPVAIFSASHRVQVGVRGAASLASMVLGVLIMVEIGWAQGLLRNLA